MKKFALLFSAIALSIGMSAQKDVKGTTEFSFNVGYDIGLQGASNCLSFQPEFGKHFTNQFYLGIGTGLFADDHFNSFNIPLFLRTEIDFPMSKCTPYISLQGGYDFNIGDDYTGAGRINPSVGVKVPVGRNVDFNLGFGYTRTIYSGAGTNLLGFKAGLSFNSNGRGFVHFLKTLDYSVELETHTPVTNSEYHSDIFNSESKAKGMIGVRLSALAPLPVKNLYAGLSLGVGRFTEKTRHFSSYGDKTYTESGVYGNVMARVKYKVKQLTLKEKFYPFAQVDLGMDCLYEPIFSVQPAVGFSYETKGKQSIDVSVGYATKRNELEQNKGCMRIAVGYTF